MNISRLWTTLSIVLVSTLILASCNRSTSKTAFSASARGIWQSGCQNYGIDNEYGQVTLNVKETTFEFTNIFYQDPQCSSSTVKFISSGELAKHENLIQDGRLTTAQIDFLIDQVSAEVLSDAKQVQYTNNATCGLTDWQLSVNIDVSNCMDILDTTVPRTEYDIYSIDTMADSAGINTDVLYTGQLRGTLADQRPIEPDYQNPYWRIGAAQAGSE